MNRSDFTIVNDADELRVDERCRELLQRFHRHLLDAGTPPAEAGELAHGADYYLRDFIVSARRANLFEEVPGNVRRFAATWYIVNTLEPNSTELSGYLCGIRALYRYLGTQQLISPEFLQMIEDECAATVWYEERILSFWQITGDGYREWLRQCPLN